MAITKLTNTITDTNTRYSVQHTGLADGATQLSDSIWANLSKLKYANATVTCDGAPTTNFCIGEVVSTNDSTAIHVRVTDYTSGASTFKGYKVTSATDITPLAWTAETATDIGTGKTLTGSVSGTSTAVTHSSTRVAIATPKINLRKLWWNIASGIDHTRIYFDGSDTEQTIAYITDSNGYINYAGGAGSITAAQFLQRFILKETPWAHLDIAGTAFSKKAASLNPGGATGFGVRLLNNLVKEYYE